MAVPPAIRSVEDWRTEAAAGPPGGTERQRAKGKLLARERIELLLDPGTFHETEPFRRSAHTASDNSSERPFTDGVITGWGSVNDRLVFVYAHDFRIFGGSLGVAHAEKIHKLYDLASRAGRPVVALCDGAGARISEGVMALAGYGGIFQRIVASSGVIPQISVVLGPAAGGAAYAPALTDLVFGVRGPGQMFITGPDVVKSVTGEETTMEELGGVRQHATRSGVVSVLHESEEECLADVRVALSYLPDNAEEKAPCFDCDDPTDRPTPELTDIVSTNMRVPYDVREVIAVIADDGETFEIHPGWAPNIVCAFIRLGGHSVGVVANQPAFLAGAIDIPASEKAARFVQLCDSFNVPILSLVDVPGFLPGIEQEHGGIVRHGAKLLYAYCNANVPRVQLVMRKAYGGAYIVMDSRSVGSDLSYSWPEHQIAVMGAEAATNILHHREILGSQDPQATRQRKMQEYEDELMYPLYAAERGLVDDVIPMASTRQALVDAFEMLRSKAPPRSRRHGNQPQ